jgi:hypothetical protein
MKRFGKEKRTALSTFSIFVAQRGKSAPNSRWITFESRCWVLKPNSYVVSEVRSWNSRKPRDWAVKIYGREVREVPTGEVIRESTNRILHVFAEQEFRFVLMARWNAPDLLEIRVPTDTSSQRIQAWKARVEQSLRVAVPLDRFRPWGLKGISRRLFDEKEGHIDVYKLGDAELEDDQHNRVRFQSHVPDTNLFGGAATESAARGMLEHNSSYNQQRVLWLKQPDMGFDTDISTMIGARSDNEVIFSRHQNSRGIDYVTGQLRTFGRR